MTYIAPEDSIFGVGFLERLDSKDKAFSLTTGPEAADVLESIKRNVSNILNTRIGGAQSAPSLGLVDFNDATQETMDLSLRIKLAIKHCIDRYEPRLKNALIYVESDLYNPLRLQFRIEAAINSEALHKKVQFSLLLDQNRKYRVF